MQNLLELGSGGSRLLFTRQHPAVWEELEKTGTYRVKEDYIRAKNGSMTSYYSGLYRWYSREAAKYITLPAGAQFPIWLSLSEESMLQPVEGSIILAVQIPQGQYLLCNAEGWGYVVNYWYVPLNKADEEAHAAELRRLGLASDDELFLSAKGNFYPLLRRKVQDSWGRIFTLAPVDLATGAIATAWELKRDWIREVRRYD